VAAARTAENNEFSAFMDDLLSKPTPQPSPQPAPRADLSLQEQFEGVRQLTLSALVLVLVIAGAFDLFLLRQYKNENAELAAAHANVDQFMSDWQKRQQPAIENFLQELSRYGQTHPDLGPILTKYSLRPPAAGAGPGPSTPSPMNLPTGLTGAPPAPAPSSRK
jgi:hypothetical protein